jgi:hypothetical protein
MDDNDQDFFARVTSYGPSLHRDSELEYAFVNYHAQQQYVQLEADCRHDHFHIKDAYSTSNAGYATVPSNQLQPLPVAFTNLGHADLLEADGDHFCIKNAYSTSNAGRATMLSDLDPLAFTNLGHVESQEYPSTVDLHDTFDVPIIS